MPYEPEIPTLPERIDQLRARVFEALGVVKLAAAIVIQDDDDTGGALEGAARLLTDADNGLCDLASELRQRTGGDTLESKAFEVAP